MSEDIFDSNGLINPKPEDLLGDTGMDAEKFIAEFLQIPINRDEYRFDLKFENRSTNLDPEYSTKGSSGFDLRANLPKGTEILKPGEFKLIPTGLYFEIPDNFEIQVRSRSGLAIKYGVAVLNSPGTVDSDYRGECSVILINHGTYHFEIKHGDRIAQGVIMSVINTNIIKLTKVDKISENVTRGENGFGSTGVS